MALVAALLMTANIIAWSPPAPDAAVAAGMEAYHRGDFAAALSIRSLHRPQGGTIAPSVLTATIKRISDSCLEHLR
jgi:hypothetical protein